MPRPGIPPMDLEALGPELSPTPALARSRKSRPLRTAAASGLTVGTLLIAAVVWPRADVPSEVPAPSPRCTGRPAEVTADEYQYDGAGSWDVPGHSYRVPDDLSVSYHGNTLSVIALTRRQAFGFD